MRREDLLDLNDVLQHPGRELAVDISTELAEEADLDLVEPLEGFLEAVSTGNLLLLNGEFKTRVVVECARCTHPLERQVEFQIEEQFPVEGVASSLNPQDSARVAPDEPFELFEANQLIVEALLRQGLLLSMPTQELCEHGWDGPCPFAKSEFRKLEAADKVVVQRPLEKLKALLGDVVPSEEPTEDARD